jgi:hypothetical protein
VIELRSADLAVGVVPHGARLARVRAPDRDGHPGDIVLGLAEEDYPADRAYLGAVVGRYANRIAGGRFVLDGREHRIPCNEPGAALHGGPQGLDHAPFVPGPVERVPGGARVVLRHHSPDGEGGFPARSTSPRPTRCAARTCSSSSRRPPTAPRSSTSPTTPTSTSPVAAAAWPGTGSGCSPTATCPWTST